MKLFLSCAGNFPVLKFIYKLAKIEKNTNKTKQKQKTKNKKQNKSRDLQIKDGQAVFIFIWYS
jgi:hypothetical protein